MLSWALIFLLLAVVAAYLGFFGLAGMAAVIAKILLVLFVVLLIVSAFSRRSSRKATGITMRWLPKDHPLESAMAIVLLLTLLFAASERPTPQPAATTALMITKSAR